MMKASPGCFSTWMLLLITQTEMSSGWTLPTIEELYGKSQAMIAQIAEEELRRFGERNTRYFADLEVKTARLFDYRLRNQRDELERRRSVSKTHGSAADPHHSCPKRTGESDY